MAKTSISGILSTFLTIMDLNNILNSNNTSQKTLNSATLIKHTSRQLPLPENYRGVSNAHVNTGLKANFSVNFPSFCSSNTLSPQLRFGKPIIKQECNDNLVYLQEKSTYKTQQCRFTLKINSSPSDAISKQTENSSMNFEQSLKKRVKDFGRSKSTAALSYKKHVCQILDDTASIMPDKKIKSISPTSLSFIQDSSGNSDSEKSLKRKRYGGHESDLDDAQEYSDSNIASDSETERALKEQTYKSKRTKAPNSAWTSEEDIKLVCTKISRHKKTF